MPGQGTRRWLRYALMGAIVIGLVVMALLALRMVASHWGRAATDRRAGLYGEGSAGAGLTPESTPGEVVEVFLRGLRNDDEELIASLTPAETEAEVLREYTRKRGFGAKVTPGAAARLNAAALRRKAALFDPSGAEIISATIGGERATVVVRGRNVRTGEPSLLRVRLIREDDVWRVHRAETARPAWAR